VTASASSFSTIFLKTFFFKLEIQSVVMDIVEISNFLIFADEEGFKEGAHVLRRLPSYFTSESRDIKEAAVSSYRRFFIGKSTEDSS
jgi:hypothetical protein